jgi:hypothetical protein
VYLYQFAAVAPEPPVEQNKVGTSVPLMVGKANVFAVIICAVAQVCWAKPDALARSENAIMNKFFFMIVCLIFIKVLIIAIVY